MNVDDLLRDALREQAAEQPPAGPGFADWVLAVRRRRRTRQLVAAVVATVAVVAVAVGVPRLYSGKSDVRPSGVVDRGNTSAHPGQSPPRELIAAGKTALAAYYIPTKVTVSARESVSERTYWLFDRKTGTYVKAPKWSVVTVAPGMKTAAVLERTLPASRIGLLDLATGEVKRWIQVSHKVGGLSFSDDGRKLVATTYTHNPDAEFHPADPNVGEPDVPSSRTGFYVLDVASGKGSWAGVTVGGQRADGLTTLVNYRQDFALTRDGRYIWAGLPSDEVDKLFYDFTGAEVPAPEDGSKYLVWFVDAGMSPDGKHVAGDFAGQTWTTSSYLIDSATGEKSEVRGQQLLAWADDKSLIAWDIGKGDSGAGKSEFHARLVLVTIGSDKEVPLSGFLGGSTDVSAGRWQPVFATR